MKTKGLVSAALVVVATGCGGKGSSPGPDSPKAEIVMPPSVATGDEGAAGKAQPEWTDAPYDEPDITAVRAENGFAVTIRVKRREGVEVPTVAVPFTDERYVFTVGSPVGELSETDLFGSGLAVDLDGDGATTSVMAVACEGAVARIGEIGVSPIGPGGSESYVYNSTSGVPKITRLGDEGARMVLYNPCDKPPVSIGIYPPGEPSELRSAPGPSLQVLVIEQVTAPDQDAAFALAELSLGGARKELIQHITYIYDASGEAPMWFATRWTLVPLDAAARVQEVGLRIAVPEGNASIRQVLAGVNASPVKGERRRLPWARFSLE